jgi:hypothetical protein
MLGSCWNFTLAGSQGIIPFLKYVFFKNPSLSSINKSIPDLLKKPLPSHHIRDPKTPLLSGPF